MVPSEAHATKKRIEEKIKHLRAEKWVEILDKAITLEKIRNSVADLKNKKACGLDSISNEIIIKCSLPSMANIYFLNI